MSENCCICLESMEDHSHFSFPCIHTIHINCAYHLIIRECFSIKCPLCRSKMYMDEVYLSSKSLKDLHNNKIDDINENLFHLKRKLCRLYIKLVFNLKNLELQKEINHVRQEIKNYQKIKDNYWHDRYALENILFLFRKIRI